MVKNLRNRVRMWLRPNVQCRSFSFNFELLATLCVFAFLPGFAWLYSRIFCYSAGICLAKDSLRVKQVLKGVQVSTLQHHETSILSVAELGHPGYVKLVGHHCWFSCAGGQPLGWNGSQWDDYVFAFHVSSWTFPTVIRGFVGSFGDYFVRWDAP